MDIEGHETDLEIKGMGHFAMYVLDRGTNVRVGFLVVVHEDEISSLSLIQKIRDRVPGRVGNVLSCMGLGLAVPLDELVDPDTRPLLAFVPDGGAVPDPSEAVKAVTDKVALLRSLRETPVPVPTAVDESVQAAVEATPATAPDETTLPGREDGADRERPKPDLVVRLTSWPTLKNCTAIGSAEIFKGKPYMQVRRWYDAGGELRPTVAGISVRTAHLGLLERALLALQADLASRPATPAPVARKGKTGR